MWRATLKGLLAKKLRLILTALSIVLGVGFMAGVYVLTDTMFKAFDDVFAVAAENTDVIVQSEQAFAVIQQGSGGGSEGREPVSEGLLPIIDSIAGVERADGYVQGFAQMIDPRTNKAIGTFGPPTMGVNYVEGTGVVLRSGRPPEGPDEVAVDAFTAAKYHLRLGDRMTIQFEGGAGEFALVGTVGYGQTDTLLGATIAVFETSTAQRMLDKEHAFDAIEVVAAEGASVADLRDEIARRLPSGVEAVTSEAQLQDQTDQLKESLGPVRTALLAFAGIALFVGAFIIFNTFSIIVAQRTRELGLLRTLGASRRQVLASVMVEAAVTGVVASLLGVGAGVLLAIGLRALMKGAGLEMSGTPLQVLPRTIIVSTIVGTAVTVVASIVPARRAARIAPIEALRDQDRPSTGRSLRRRLLVGSAMTGAGVLSLGVGLFGDLPEPVLFVGSGAAVTFLGLATLSPFIARPLARVLGAPLSRRLTGRLGRENAMRNPRRTAATANALMIGLGLMVLVAVFGASTKASVNAALEKALRADLIVTTESFAPFSPGASEAVRELPEVATVVGLRQAGVRIEGGTQFVSAFPPDDIGAVADLQVTEGTLDGLHGDGIAIARDTAEAEGWSLDDTLRVAFPATGVQELSIVAIYDDNTLAGNFAIGSLTYEKNLTENLDAYLLVKGREGVAPDVLKHAVEDALAKRFPNVQVQDQAAFREKYADLLNRALAMISALLLLAVIIALFGVANTLSLSIYERIREIGLVRAVGMTRVQVGLSVVTESVIIAVMGGVLGVIVGLAFGWALVQALATQGFDVFAVPVAQLVTFIVLTGVAGVLAALFPAWRASRIDVLRAIAFE